MTTLLDDKGYTVLDALDERVTSDLPRLVYQDTTADTAQSLHSLVEAKQVDPEKCCALLDRASGIVDIKQTGEDLGVEITHICSAEVYDDWFRRVRQWVRMGYTNEQIQQELDATFSDILGN